MKHQQSIIKFNLLMVVDFFFNKRFHNQKNNEMNFNNLKAKINKDTKRFLNCYKNHSSLL
jgi:hypothetical protein